VTPSQLDAGCVRHREDAPRCFCRGWLDRSSRNNQRVTGPMKTYDGYNQVDNNTVIVKGILVSGVMIVCGLVMSSFIVSASWAIFIHERAYHCRESFSGFFGAFLGFMDTLDSCRQCDELTEGWTWGRIECYRKYHVAAFWIIALCP